jgi:hypothetical protein
MHHGHEATCMQDARSDGEEMGRPDRAQFLARLLRRVWDKYESYGSCILVTGQNRTKTFDEVWHLCLIALLRNRATPMVATRKCMKKR